MATDESAREPSRPSDLACASGVNIFGWSKPPKLTASFSHGVKRRYHWLETLGDDNPRLLKLFSEDSTRKFRVVSDPPVAIGSFPGAIADAVLHDHNSPRRPSPARLDSFRDLDRGAAAAPRMPSLMAVPTLVPDRLDRKLSPVSSALVASYRPFIVWPGDSSRLGGLGGSVPSPNSRFPFVSVYLSRF